MTRPATVSAAASRERERRAFGLGFTIGVAMALAAVLIVVALAGAARAAEGFRAVDGDTLEVLATGERIRLLGVNTPEMDAGCEAEADGAWAAQLVVQNALDAAGSIEIERHGRDRYGRTLARVYLDGHDLSAALIQAGIGRPYDGGRRQGWCG